MWNFSKIYLKFKIFSKIQNFYKNFLKFFKNLLDAMKPNPKPVQSFRNREKLPKFGMVLPTKEHVLHSKFAEICQIFIQKFQINSKFSLKFLLEKGSKVETPIILDANRRQFLRLPAKGATGANARMDWRNEFAPIWHRKVRWEPTPTDLRAYVGIVSSVAQKIRWGGAECRRRRSFAALLNRYLSYCRLTSCSKCPWVCEDERQTVKKIILTQSNLKTWTNFVK